jgi:hypothetical protein
VTGTRIAIVFSLAAGIAGAAQASISGALGRRVGTIGSAGFGVVLAAVLVVSLAVALGRGGRSSRRSISRSGCGWVDSSAPRSC